MESLNLKLEQYEGPLDLLLALIGKQKIDIFDIPIFSLCEQYMEYIDAMTRMNMELTTDFLYMASELMLIKSRMLLPKKEDEEDPRKSLVDALLEHQRAKAAAEFLKKQSETFFDRFTKEPDETDGVYVREHAVELLLAALDGLKERTSPKEKQKVELFDRFEHEHFYTVEGKICFLMRLLYDGNEHSLYSLFSHSHSRSETVAIFMALLELVRGGRIVLIKDKKQLYLKMQHKNKEEAT